MAVKYKQNNSPCNSRVGALALKRGSECRCHVYMEQTPDVCLLGEKMGCVYRFRVLAHPDCIHRLMISVTI